MNPDLEALLKAWDAYSQAKDGLEAERLLAIYESKLEEVSGRTKASQEILHRIVRRVFRRWQWADSPKFPRDLRDIPLD